jgi:hypothetical protein
MARTRTHAAIIREAHLDAVAYYEEFRRAAGFTPSKWVLEAWVEVRLSLGLSPEVAEILWPAYWQAFARETGRLAARFGGGGAL